MLPALAGAIGAMSEPMVSHDCVAFYLLSPRRSAKHVKVVQSGQGADEVFAGYHWYPPMAEPRRRPGDALAPLPRRRSSTATTPRRSAAAAPTGARSTTTRAWRSSREHFARPARDDRRRPRRCGSTPR